MPAVDGICPGDIPKDDLEEEKTNASRIRKMGKEGERNEI